MRPRWAFTFRVSPAARTVSHTEQEAASDSADYDGKRLRKALLALRCGAITQPAKRRMRRLLPGSLGPVAPQSRHIAGL